MRKKLKRSLAWIVPLAVVVFYLVPMFTGVIFQLVYQHLISVYNADGQVNIQIKEYQRGWFYSHAILQVRVLDPQFKALLQTFNIQHPPTIFTINQEIIHGPIIINHQARLRSWFGLASLHNTMNIAKQGKFIVEDDDLISFAGNCYKYFKIPPFTYNGISDLTLNFKRGLEGSIRFHPKQKRLSGDIYLFDFAMENQNTSLTISNLTVSFNQMKSPHHLWLGRLSVFLPEIEGHDDSGNFKINGLVFDGSSSEQYGQVNDFRRIDVDTIQLGKQNFGPGHIQFSVTGLDAQAIQDLITSYRKIVDEGERYESQLEYKITMMLPKVFSDKTIVKLDNFELQTPVGGVYFNGSLSWPQSLASSPDDMTELFQVSDAQAHLRMASVLGDRIVKFVSELPYFRKMTEARRKVLLGMQSDMELINQQNYLLLSDFVRKQYMSETAGLSLLEMQKNNDSVDDYAAQVKDLLLRKEITLAASYLLLMKYSQVKASGDAFDQAFLGDQDKLTEEFQAKFVEWLKAGYIQQVKDEYIVSLQKKGDVLILNGKEVK